MQSESGRLQLKPAAQLEQQPKHSDSDQVSSDGRHIAVGDERLGYGFGPVRRPMDAVVTCTDPCVTAVDLSYYVMQVCRGGDESSEYRHCKRCRWAVRVRVSREAGEGC